MKSNIVYMKVVVKYNRFEVNITQFLKGSLE